MIPAVLLQDSLFVTAEPVVRGWALQSLRRAASPRAIV
jgi:hypothetical protein